MALDTKQELPRPGITVALDVLGAIAVIGALGAFSESAALGLMILASAIFYLAMSYAIQVLAGIAVNTRDLGLKLTALNTAATVIKNRLEGPLPVTLPTRYHNARYYYDDPETGPFSKAEMQDFHSMGYINDETKVIREGDDQWRTFADYPDLAAR